MAGTADTYQRTHPGTAPETFEKLRNRLAYFAERKASLGATRPRIILVYVVIAHNYDGLVPFAEFASEVRANGVQYKPVDDMHDPNLSMLVLSREEAEDVKEQLMEVGAFLKRRRSGTTSTTFLQPSGGNSTPAHCSDHPLLLWLALREGRSGWVRVLL